MPTETELAFAHPEDRSHATATRPADRISLRDHIVEADIGAFQQERGHRQRLRVNVVVEVAPPGTPLDDDVDRILSYDRITEAIADELAATRLNLLETLAEGVARRILSAKAALRVFLRIEKLDVGPYALGVEIVRTRADGLVPPEGAGQRPLVAYLDAATIAAPGLAGRLDALIAAGRPLVLTVGLPDLPRPVTGHRPTQRRIDLLAIEQSAWALAARDRRCVVVATRTEMDWAIRRQRPVVWAPSKLVLDAAQGPEGSDPVALTQWLAEVLDAAGLVIHGPLAPWAESRVPVTPGDGGAILPP
jgi:dihydroneopterin aldolase